MHATAPAAPAKNAARFRAFSFVDRILEWTPGRFARGRYAIPAHVAFAQSLVAEAVGQLAAWVSMQHVDWRGRPVAGIAAETLFHRTAAPGETLELEIAIDNCDDQAVLYDGRARVGGVDLLELRHCVGPMLPMTDFDDPAAMKADFEQLITLGREPGAFAGLPPLAVETTSHDRGRRIGARLCVPASAPFFGDHFPRRPVFPGTLLLDAQIGLAFALARDAAPSSAPRLHRVSNAKMRSFIEPGAVVDIEAAAREGQPLAFDLAARVDGRNVAAARVELA
jgi:3-hydroxymyristoyl/3-hydroxydecanoyl-(acyl carrier protein) dehydratase